MEIIKVEVKKDDWNNNVGFRAEVIAIGPRSGSFAMWVKGDTMADAIANFKKQYEMFAQCMGAKLEFCAKIED